MNKKVILVLFISLTHLSTNAQLYVDEDGYTVVGGPGYYEGVFNVITKADQPHYSILSFIHAGRNATALEVYNCPDDDFNYYTGRRGIYSCCELFPNNTCSGIESYVAGSTSQNTGRAYGVLSFVKDATPGWNFGVCTSLSSNTYGAGLYASSGNNPNGLNVNGCWAGYFDGNTKVIGNLTATTITTTSDYRLKENIRKIDNGSLDKVMGLNVVKYRLKNLEVDLGDTAQTVSYTYPEDSPILNIEHYGLIAQELKEIYPNLVIEGEDGYYSVNYIELIPILIKSIQELKTKIDALENGNETSKTMQRDNENTMKDVFNLQAILYQNDPNPFTENTTIECMIPSNIQNAVLYFYDMNGKQIDSRTISERGDVTITVQGNSLNAGIYMYSLVTDGKLVETNRMILTKEQ